MNWKTEKKRLLKRVYDLAQKKEYQMKMTSKDAQERANEAEGASKSRYDTFKEEGQYLAGGLAICHEEMKRAVAVIRSALDTESLKKAERVGLYSIVEIEFVDGDEKKFFIVPVLGGEIIANGITLITPASPVGNAIMGKEEGSLFKYSVENNLKEGEIVFLV